MNEQPQHTPILKLEKCGIYQSDYRVLSNVNLELAYGEFAYLIGKVGSGKSSIIRTLNGELPLKEGHAKVLNYELENLDQDDLPYLRREIGVVFQDFQLLPDRTVEDNLKFVLQATGWKKRDCAARIDEVLNMVGMGGMVYSYPQQLSGGEQQRVAIARALLNNPSLLLADEPTGNLDPETSYAIMDILISLKDSGRSVLMVTHNYHVLKKYPFTTYRCEDGHLTLVEQDQEINFDELRLNV